MHLTGAASRDGIAASDIDLLILLPFDAGLCSYIYRLGIAGRPQGIETLSRGRNWPHCPGDERHGKRRY
jgi:hypothetical protein